MRYLVSFCVDVVLLASVALCAAGVASLVAPLSDPLSEWKSRINTSPDVPKAFYEVSW